MFSCYLDDSADGPVVTMAGFVAHISQWDQIERTADEILNRYGVPVFHAMEFHRTKGVFKDWTKIKKRSLATELFSSLKGSMYAVSMTAKKSAFDEAKKRTGKHQRMTTYGFCFAAIVTHILMNSRIGDQVREQGVSFLVESGNANNAEIRDHFQFTAKYKAYEKHLRSLTFISKNNCRAIQLADYWAYYSRRTMRDHLRFEGKVALPANFYREAVRENFPVWEKGNYDFSERAMSDVKDFDSIEEIIAFAKKVASGQADV